MLTLDICVGFGPRMWMLDVGMDIGHWALGMGMCVGVEHGHPPTCQC